MKGSKRPPPAYQQAGIDPKQGGKSLLHNEFGFPKTPATTKKKKEKIKEITSDVVFIKASDKNALKKAKYNEKKGLPSKKAEQDFLCNVGNNEEHVWYPDSVTGKNSEIIDNNDEVDIEALQGLNPSLDTKNEIYENPVIKRLISISESVQTILDSQQKIDFLDFKEKLFSENGPITKAISNLNVSPDLRGEYNKVIFKIIESISNYIILKEKDLLIPREEIEEDTEFSIKDLQPKEFVIFIDDKFINKAYDFNSIKKTLNHLVIEKSIPIERIYVYKRLSIDFGVVVE